MSSIVSSSITTGRESTAPAKQSNWISRYCRKLVFDKLASFEGQPISLSDRTEQDSVTQMGKGDLEFVVRDAKFYRRVITGGSLGAAESYIRGEWDTENLTDLLRVFVREIKKGFQFSKKYSLVSDMFSKMYHWARRNTRVGSKKNISAHYDLGNEFFKLMLDETMTYSSGCFTNETTSLKASQVEKYRRLAEMLELKESDHLLEVGTGWGGMAIFAAAQYGCRVTTTTISQEQYDFAKQRIRQLGLQDKITLLLKDYRDLEGQFDKVVSIEMIEAVGHKFLPAYFKTCSSLLKPGGRFSFQAISMPDQTYQQYLRRADFIQRYVFPGSCCPAMSAMVGAYSQTDFRLEQSDNIGLDYATTLRIWRENCDRNLGKFLELGYSEEFTRLWRYYLCYCEAGFAEQYLSNYQIVLSKGGTSCN